MLFAAVAALIFFSGFSSAWYGADDFEYLRVLDTEPSLFSRAVKGEVFAPEVKDTTYRPLTIMVMAALYSLDNVNAARIPIFALNILTGLAACGESR